MFHFHDAVYIKLTYIKSCLCSVFAPIHRCSYSTHTHTHCSQNSTVILQLAVIMPHTPMMVGEVWISECMPNS